MPTGRSFRTPDERTDGFAVAIDIILQSNVRPKSSFVKQEACLCYTGPRDSDLIVPQCARNRTSHNRLLS